MTGFAYFEWSVEGEVGEVDLDDRSLWAEGNPSLGMRRSNGTGLSEEFVAGVERGSMTDEEFARERLGIFDDQDDVVDEDPVISPEDWAACLDVEAQRRALKGRSVPPGARLLDPVCFAIHLTPARTMASICVVGGRADGLVHGELVDRRAGSGWVVDRMVELRDRWGTRSIVLDPGTAAGALLPDLVKADLEITTVTAREYAQGCGDLWDDIIERRFRHLGQAELDAAVAGVQQRKIGQAWGWADWDDQVDRAPLVGITLAHWAHNQPADPVELEGPLMA